MDLDLTTLSEIVAKREFGRLVGEVENHFFDAKSQPHRFEPGLDGKREFAKDVAAFANADGGYILTGFATKRSAMHAGEEVSEVRPISHDLFDADQQRKILFEWLYPEPKGVRIDSVQFGDDPEKRIGVVFVPLQDERLKPFLIKRALGDKKSTELLIGYAERRHDATAVRTVMEIHQALRMGMNLGSELLGRMANLEERIERHFSASMEAETVGKRIQLLNQRIGRLLTDVEA